MISIAICDDNASIISTVKNAVELETTKSDKQLHGIGINSVKQTVKEYKGTFVTEHTDGIFNAEIMIPM